MELTKYQQVLLQNVQEQLHKWFSSPVEQQIPFNEVTYFLLTTKYSANSLNLIGLEQVCDLLVEQLELKNKIHFSSSELHLLIQALIDLSIEWNHFIPNKVVSVHPNKQVPLIHLIEDDISMHILLKDLLESVGYIVVGHTEAHVALKQLYDISPDCIVFDATLPDKTGIEFLKELNNYFGKKFIPKIMISSDTSKSLRMSAYQYGADDFINKPIELDEFLIRLQRQIERKDLFDQSSLLDELTQIHNRKYLKEIIRQLEQEFVRKREPYTIAILDLDFFKKVNDTYGHLIGDKVLIYFAHFLKQRIRTTDSICRFGGEEFVLVFRNMLGHQAKNTLTTLIEEFKQIPFNEGETTFFVSFSAGISHVESEIIPLDTLLSYADQALYIAKNNGRSRAELASRSSNQQKIISYVVIDNEKHHLKLIEEVASKLKLPNTTIETHYFVSIQQFQTQYKFIDSRDQYFFIHNVFNKSSLLNAVASIKQHPHTKVTLFTCRDLLGTVAEALKHGADDYLSHPIKLSDIENRIQRDIRNR